MLPACLVTLRTLATVLTGSVDGHFWTSAGVWHFGIGMIVAVVWFFFLPRPVRLYVWGHEMTHALFAMLSLGSVRGFRVSKDGGHVLTNKNNVAIALSPYCLPIFSLIALLIFTLTGQCLDLTLRWPLPWGGSLSPVHVLYAILGLTWAFHVCFTVWMIGKDQPDLRINGAFFSFLLILLLNLLVLATLLVTAAPDFGPRELARLWMRTATESITSLGGLIRTLGP